VGAVEAARRGVKVAIGAEPPPEITALRISYNKPPVPYPVFATCTAASPLATEFLRQEGFTDVQFVGATSLMGNWQNVAAGKADVGATYGAFLIFHHLDKGAPITILGGGHTGCFELFATDRVRAIRDLKGKTIGIGVEGSVEHIYLSSILAYIGLDPRRDVTWATHSGSEVAIRLLAEGKIDAYMAFPPFSQEARAKKIGHVIVNSMMDQPWSQYFCCMPAANRDFVRKYPVATKRWLRAYLRAADVSAREPERAANFLVNEGFTTNYGYAVQTFREIGYDRWRDHDPEDTVRFYALRLREAGMIRSTPQRIIAQGTDWRFLKEIKRELKGKSSLPGMHPHRHGG
jgi:NitT/TauT family transport system substrate-binding protein